MTKPGYTHIHVVLDRSGSMAPIADDVKKGLAAFIAEQAKAPGDCTFSLTDFDTEHRTVIEWADIKAVGEIPFMPRGGTALNDAVCFAVDGLGKRLAALPEEKRPSKVIVVVQTDGQENSSIKHSLADVKARIERQRSQFAWDFVFLGANIDAFAAGASMGVGFYQTATWNATAAGVASTYAVTSNAVLRSRVTGQSFGYTTDEQTTISTTK